jgi:preprotein translocase SecF subunit
VADKYKDKKTPKNAAPVVTPAASEASYDDVKHEHRLYFNIVKKRYIWFVLSLLLMIPGIISLCTQGLNLSIDYKGGSMFNIQFNEKVTQADINQAIDSVGLTGSVQLTNGDISAIVRTEALDQTERDELLAAIQKQAGTFDIKNVEEQLVQPAIGNELKSGAMKSLAVASVLILIYVSFRFRFVYAVSSVIALLHDIVITLGLFSLFQWEIDAAFIAAILTIFGYSINDTVVIYDRIRENERRMKKKDSFEDMVDKSVWQTMGRSVKTVCTVLIALLAIFFLGGESTRTFSLAMIIGVFFGAYSSICIASQLVVEIKKRTSGDNKKDNPVES